MSTQKKNMKTPSIKILKIGYILYGAKPFEGNKLLKYTQKNEKHYKDHCLKDNSNWFGNYEVSKSYSSENIKIYKFSIIKNTNLIKINKSNKYFFKNAFENTNTQLKPLIKISKQQLKHISFNHPYLDMTDNQKAYYEFAFVFGYIDLEEQYKFLQLINYLISNNFIEIKGRKWGSNKSIIQKLNIKKVYYKIIFFKSKNKLYNRLSFYEFDKQAIANLCKILNPKYLISGVYYSNNDSFWFPNFYIYKMNIEEFILFNPHKNLKFVKMVE